MENTQFTIKSFLERFYSFSDAVIKDISLSFRRSGELGKASVELSCRDEESTSADKWINLIIHLKEVVEFAIHESERESYQVLSNELHILKSEDLLFIDFGALVDEPTTSGELRESRFYFVCKDLAWEAVDYRD